MVSERDFEIIRNDLIEEAVSSPNLLSDLAGLEKYIAESYVARSFIELLQNADDACATKFLIKRAGEHLIVANDGRPFSCQDMEALCRSAASKKEKETSIGFRGIGFKSVVGFARTIHLISGELEITFCRDLTSKLIPRANTVPLVRIPHPIDKAIRDQLTIDINLVLDDGYKTIFIFSGLISDYVETEFKALEPTAMLFLQSVSEIKTDGDSTSLFLLNRKPIDAFRSVNELVAYESATQWTIFKRKSVSIALRMAASKYMKAPTDEAVVHTFLPTQEVTGFGFKINGMMSTDPSRTKLIFDETTNATIREAASLYITLLEMSLENRSDWHESCLADSLTPNSDPRVIALQKQSFVKLFTDAIRSIGKGRLAHYYRKPRWLNSQDTFALAQCAGLKTPPRELLDNEGLDQLLKYLDVKEITISAFSKSLMNCDITRVGAAQIVANIVMMLSTNTLNSKELSIDWRVWWIDDSAVPLDEAISKHKPLDNDFVDMVTEHVGFANGLPKLIAAITDEKTAKRLVPTRLSLEQVVETMNTRSTVLFNNQASVVKWRSAEQQVLEIFNAIGWKAKDVSRQNLGYDIEAENDTGEMYYVEVKSLKYEGQEFVLTSNEESNAREKGDSYLLALVVQKEMQLNIMYLKNPIAHLKLERQCRQWVWVCSTYDLTPTIYRYKE